MPSLHSPLISALIHALPVNAHCEPISASQWAPKFAAAGQQAIYNAIFPNAQDIRISREQLLHPIHGNPVQRCAEILLWGYPTDQRGIVSRLLPEIQAISHRAQNQLDWEDYADSFDDIEGIGISTITKLAHFYQHNFGGHRALILDSRLIQNTARWDETVVPGLRYDTAIPMYPQYLNRMHQAAGNLGCSADQLEFFLFALGDSF